MSFDRVAPFYRPLETLVFGAQLQRARLAFLPEIGSPRRVLIVGEGDGRFLAEFVRQHPGAAVECVDASTRMIARARARLGGGGVQFIRADIGNFALVEGRYDLIVTHFFLDCFADDPLREIIEKLARAATRDATWLLADFRVPESGWPRLQARLLIGAMYRFFRRASGLATDRLVDPSPLLLSAGFTRRRQLLTRGGMIKTELWQRPPNDPGGALPPG